MAARSVRRRKKGGYKQTTCISQARGPLSLSPCPNGPQIGSILNLWITATWRHAPPPAHLAAAFSLRQTVIAPPQWTWFGFSTDGIWTAVITFNCDTQMVDWRIDHTDSLSNINTVNESLQRPYTGDGIFSLHAPLQTNTIDADVLTCTPWFHI